MDFPQLVIKILLFSSPIPLGYVNRSNLPQKNNLDGQIELD